LWKIGGKVEWWIPSLLCCGFQLADDVDVDLEEMIILLIIESGIHRIVDVGHGIV
jgi:hypothetical protein